MKKPSTIERKIMPRPVPAMRRFRDDERDDGLSGGASERRGAGRRSGPGVQLFRGSCDPSVPPVRGITPHRPIREMQLKKAELLPETTDRDVPKVAVQCGLRSPSVFCRVFRREKGASPEVWRKRRTPPTRLPAKKRTILQKRAGSIQKMTGLYKLVCLTGF